MTVAIERAKRGRVHNVVILPPESGDVSIPSDEEEVPENEDDIQEVASEVELDMEDNSSNDEEDDDDSDSANQRSKSVNISERRWRKNDNFMKSLPNEVLPKLEEKHPEILQLTEFEMWKKIFDNDMMTMITEQSELYA